MDNMTKALSYLLGLSLGITTLAVARPLPVLAQEQIIQESQQSDPSAQSPTQAGSLNDGSMRNKRDNRPGTIEDITPTSGDQVTAQNLILSAWGQSKSRRHCPPAGFLRTRLHANGTIYPSEESWAVVFEDNRTHAAYLIEGEALMDSDRESDAARRVRLTSTWSTFIALPDFAPGAYGVTGPIGEKATKDFGDPYGTEGLSAANIYIPGIRCRYRLISNIKDDVHQGLMKNMRLIPLP